MLEIVNEKVNVEVSRDKMLGVIWFTPPGEGGKLLTLEEIRLAVANRGISKGIDEDALIELSQTKKYDYKYIIAQGKKAVNGIDATLTFNFDPKRLVHFIPKQNEDGTVDFKDLGTVFNVKKGDVLATKTFPTQGENGYNVLGGVVRARKGKDIRLPKGKNTEILEDTTLVAGVDGKLEYDGHNVYINTVYTVSGDVDSSTGNIKFIGSVVVRGTVHAGFTIEAEGSVEVQGPVEDATIIAGGDIILTYGIQGTEKGKIVSGGNVIAKFIQNANVEAKGDIITEAIIHGVATAGNSIRVEMGKGTIVGGNIAATNMIVARSIGSPMGTATAVQIGVPSELYQEHRRMADELKERKEDLSKLDKSVKFLNTKLRENALDLNRKVMLSKLNASRGPLVEEIDELKHKFKTLSDTLSGAQDGLIRVNDAIYPGVKITLGNVVKYIDDIQHRVTVKKVDGELSIL